VEEEELLFVEVLQEHMEHQEDQVEVEVELIAEQLMQDQEIHHQ
jgi:hypothetical protein